MVCVFGIIEEVIGEVLFLGMWGFVFVDYVVNFFVVMIKMFCENCIFI